MTLSHIICKCCKKQNRIIFDGSLTLTFLEICGVRVLESFTKNYADLLYVVSKVSSEYCFPVKCKVGLSWLTDSSVTTRISCSKWAKTTSSKDLSTWRWETLGNHQSKRIAFCQCEAPVVTILHLQLWPGSPDRPTTAFHFRLMDMAVDKFIHCQVSLSRII